MPRVVLFDLDGTLIDSSELHIRACDHALRALAGVAATRDELLAGMGQRLVDFFARWAPDRAGPLRDAAVAYYRDHHADFIRTYRGVPELLRGLDARGLAMAIVSSKPRRSIDLDLETLGFADYFPVRIAAEDVQRGKPDPEAVRLALAQLHAPAAEALYIGDHPNDVQAARAAGVPVAGALWDPVHRSALRAARPDFLLAAPGDLLALLGVLMRGAA